MHSLWILLAAAAALHAGPFRTTTPKTTRVSVTPFAAAPLAAALPSIPSVQTVSLSPVPAAPPSALAASPLLRPAARAFSLPGLGAPAVSFPSAQALPLPAAAPSPLGEALTRQSDAIREAIVSDPSGMAAREGLDQVYLGSRGRGQKASQNGGGRAQQGRGFDASKDTVFIVNDEGVPINGRAAAYYKEVRRLVGMYQSQLDLAESLDVMDDTYGDVWSKLIAIESIATKRGIERHNTHLEETLVWVDGVMKDPAGRQIAVHTHRVYFHPAKNPESEIKEGIRRVDRYIEQAAEYFARAGKAEKALGPLDEVVLAFDARGYAEIKSHLKAKEAEVQKRFGARFKFAYVDELATMPAGKQQTRDELARLVRKYKGQGLQKIIEGVIYSRYVGILLELKTVEHFYHKGYKILQSGRDLFTAEGHYITELDTVVRSPEGRLSIVEAKSARVKIPHEEALQDKVLYKLDTYKKFQPRIEEVIGGPFDVVFSFDVGRNQDLAVYLKGKEQELSEKYGFRVSFLIIESVPEEQE